MTSELEAKLRAALHERGAAITADRLRSAADSPNKTVISDPAWTINARAANERRPRPRGARLAPILVVASVVAVIAGVAVSLALVGGGGSRPTEPAASQSSALTGVLGRTWALRTVQAPDGTTTTISPSTGASITFLGTGNRLSFQDSVGAFQAAYTQIANGELNVHDVTGSPGHYSGNDRSQLAAIAGIDAIGVPLGPDAPPPIRVALVSGQLQITTQGYQLTFDNPVPVAPSASVLPPGPPTATTTTAAPARPTGS